MLKTLQFFSLEICHAHSEAGKFYFKKLKGDWYFRLDDSAWQLIEAEELDKFFNTRFIKSWPKVIEKTNTRKAKICVEKILVLDMTLGIKS